MKNGNNKKKEAPNSQDREIKRLLEDSQRSLDEAKKQGEYINQLIEQWEEYYGIPKGAKPEDYAYYAEQAREAQRDAEAKQRADYVRYWRRKLRTIESQVSKSGFIVSAEIIKGMGWGDN